MHKYHLERFIKALIIQKLFAFNFDYQLILVLKCSDDCIVVIIFAVNFTIAYFLVLTKLTLIFA